jgi:hypothetical protein
MSINFKFYFFLSSLMVSLFVIPPVVSADCNTPAECFVKAQGILNQDREEMRRQLNKYQEMYEKAVKENNDLRQTIASLESKFNSKVSEISQNFQTQLNSMKTYLERPYTSINTILYQSRSLNTNLSTITLNGMIPQEAKKILLYVAYYSGSGYDSHGEISVFTKVSGSLIKRLLKFDSYQQNAYNTNSSVFEMDLDGIDMNLYFQSDVNYTGGNFYFTIKVIGYK